MSYFDRLARFAIGDFARVQVRLQEFVPGEFAESEGPEAFAERQYPAVTQAPAAATQLKVSASETSDERLAALPRETVIESETRTTEIDITREATLQLVSTPVTHVSVDQRRADYRSLVQQIRSEFAFAHHTTRVARQEISNEKQTEVRHRTDRHTERIDRTTHRVEVPSKRASDPGSALADNPPATSAATKSAPEVHVHIGRIDVKVPTAKAEKEIAPEKPRGVISLEEYLAQRRRN